MPNRHPSGKPRQLSITTMGRLSAEADGRYDSATFSILIEQPANEPREHHTS